MTDEERVKLITQIASNFGISCDDASYIVKSFENCRRMEVDRMTVRDFLKNILDGKTRKKKIKIRYGAGYYTFYVEDFKFIKDCSGTGLVIGKILDEGIEVL